MSKQARFFIYAVCLAGLATTVYGGVAWKISEPIKFCAYLLTAMLASRLKVEIPEITGTISVNFLFILIGIAELTFTETLILGCSAILVQCLLTRRRLPKLEQVLFNVSSAAVAIAAAYFIYHGPLHTRLHPNSAFLLMLSAAVYFLFNTLPVATIIALTENKQLQKIWTDCYFWSLPYYLAGGAIAALFGWLTQKVGWQPTLLALPAMFVIYRSYRLYLGKLEDEKNHVAEMAALHMRTIEALALAIEAKDQTTHDHLERVRVYAVEMAKRLKLPPDEIEALRAAALLHDIGKLAVPEHIISKPGRLTPEEFEKMKIHPIVGAEILERVHFPYPVVPIVRAHHERWDGTGYPDGLIGEQIPMGARILSAVDCLDALATDRQYRKALPLEDAMQWVTDQAGKAYDPVVINMLKSSYKELETIVRLQSHLPERQKLSTDMKVERGKEPANGFAAENVGTESGAQAAFLSSIAAARQEAQVLFELTQDLGNSLSLSETLSVLSGRLKRLVPYDAIATYIVRGNELLPEYVNGENFRLFSSLEIPVGEGLSGWVAQNRKPILNGNPSVEAGYMGDPAKFSTLRSALALPLEGLNGAVGVLALYRAEKDAFTKDNLRILLAISSKISLAIENALKYRQVENSATIDYLTNLPNARSLFLRLDSELARCRRMNIPLAVLVCDLDGFKQVNDGFGHLTGNKVLSSVANGLKANCREYDYVARMGGDEFVLLLPHITPESVDDRINQMMRIAAEAGEIIPGKRFLSMSVGEAFYPLDGSNAEELLATADRRMYKNKQQQRLQRPDGPAVMKEAALEVLSLQ